MAKRGKKESKKSKDAVASAVAEMPQTPTTIFAEVSAPAAPSAPVAPPESSEPLEPPVPEAPPPPAPEPVVETKPALLFEIAWEVCWQLGGIYTVLRTKAATMLQTWGDRYFLIGPYNPQTAAWEFEEQPTEGIIRQTLDKLRDAGIPCHFGRWLIPGRPRVILLDYRARFRTLDADKYLLWKDHGVSTLASDGEVNEVCAFGFTVAQFFEELTKIEKSRPILAHFHEWMGGVAVPRIAHLRLPMQTVFTTHATLLGRYLASDSPDFYNHLPFINPDAEAHKYNITPRFQIERAAAHASTVFTTVSEVTAIEAEKLLGRMPDVILPNGLNIHKFAAPHEFQHLHRQYKEKIHEFVMGHFFPSYTFDLDHTLYFFTSGRYEYRNKGMDVFIEAMHRLNQRMRGVPGLPTVVAFIVTRASTRSINVNVLQNQSMFDDLKNWCAELERRMGRKLFTSAAQGRIPATIQELLDDDSIVRLKQSIQVFRNRRQPTIVTHDLAEDSKDPVMNHLRHRWLLNGPDDPVKVVFHPEFVTATSPLISLDYEQFVRGCHMGIFPSYYEPWGYTPMESIALGVPAVTTDLSGFGAYMQRHFPDEMGMAMRVLNRGKVGFEATVDQLVDHLFAFVKLNRRQRIELRNKVERQSELFDWSELVKHYNEAHELALKRGLEKHGKFEVRFV